MDTAMYIDPEISVPLPTTFAQTQDMLKKAQAMCNSADKLFQEGAIQAPSPAHAKQARALFVQDKIPPAVPNEVALHLKALITQYDVQIIESAHQLRTYITNKLLEETDNKSAPVRLKALELLGKIGDVGLFVEKQEITIKNQNAAELQEAIRAKLSKFMGIVHPIDSGAAQEVQDIVDYDKPFEPLCFQATK